MWFRNETSANRTPDGLRTRKPNGLSRVLNFHCNPNLIPKIHSYWRFQPLQSFFDVPKILSRQALLFYVESEPRGTSPVPNIESLVFTPWKYAIYPDRDLNPEPSDWRTYVLTKRPPRPNRKQATRGHSLALVKSHSRLDIRKYTFSQRVVNDWNKLPEECINATSVNMFKNKIDQYYLKTRRE